MKLFGLMLALISGSVLTLSGCQKSTVEGPAGRKLTVTKPSDQTIRRGEENKVRVAIGRDNFKAAVDVKFENLPAGVQVLDATPRILDGDNSADFTLKATDAATVVNNHEAKVTVTGPQGLSVTESFKITVKDKS